jgi:hypothetical protein
MLFDEFVNDGMINGPLLPLFMLCNGSPLEMIAQLLGGVSATKLDFDRRDLPKLSSRSLLRL